MRLTGKTIIGLPPQRTGMRFSPKLIGAFLAIAGGLALLGYFLHFRTKAAPDAGSPGGPKVLWHAAVAPKSLTVPALGQDGTIYAGSEDGLYAVSAGGKLLWK